MIIWVIEFDLMTLLPNIWMIEWKGFEENGWKSLSLVDFSRILYYSKIAEGISVKAHITNYFMIHEKDWGKGK